MTEAYRKNVGIVVFKENKVLLCARADFDEYHWQFPQGGIDEGESLTDAAKRELYEETGIQNVRLVCTISEPIRYNFPKNFEFLPFKGQDQYWCLFEFLGNDDEIKFDIDPKCIEFKAFKWDNIDVAVEEIVYFKKNVYKKVTEQFKPFVEQQK